MSAKGKIFVGIGGWNFAPWRGAFYPKGLVQAKELAYASAHLTSIEINSTFYGSQKPETFRKWARETPDGFGIMAQMPELFLRANRFLRIVSGHGRRLVKKYVSGICAIIPDGFVFSVKGPRYATNRRVLAEAGDSIKRFLASGVLELGDRLGPILWQFTPTKKFDRTDFGAFLKLLPRKMGGKTLRHVVEVRHDSFRDPSFIALLREFSTPVVFAEHATYPAIADITGDFVYTRLQKGKDSIATGYPAPALDQWADRVRLWAKGGTPSDLPHLEKKRAASQSRDVFAYFIHEGKIRAPAAAMALIERLKRR